MKGYRRMCIVALFSFAAATFADAQVPKFGVTGGINFATVSDMAGATKTGLVIGGLMDFSIVGPLSIRPEVLFSMKGYKSSNGGFGSGGDATVGLNYIEVPVLAIVSARPSPRSPFIVGLFAGPDFAYRVGVNSLVSSNGQTTETSSYVSSITNKYDFNVAFGLGIAIPLTATTLGLEIRYTHGTGSIFKEATDTRNGVVSLMASLEI